MDDPHFGSDFKTHPWDNETTFKGGIMYRLIEVGEYLIDGDMFFDGNGSREWRPIQPFTIAKPLDRGRWPHRREIKDSGIPDKFELLINQNNMENGSNTPDFLLAGFLHSCLEAFDNAVRERDKWYSVELAPGKKHVIEPLKREIQEIIPGGVIMNREGFAYQKDLDIVKERVAALEVRMSGTTPDIVPERTEICPLCKGLGWYSLGIGSAREECHRCNGTGKLPGKLE
jgi:hypothetical protein